MPQSREFLSKIAQVSVAGTALFFASDRLSQSPSSDKFQAYLDQTDKTRPLGCSDQPRSDQDLFPLPIEQPGPPPEIIEPIPGESPNGPCVERNTPPSEPLFQYGEHVIYHKSST